MTKRSRPADWREAQQRTLDLWGKLRRSIAEPDEIKLLTGIHTACGLCELSSEEKAAALAAGAAEDSIKCDFCPFFDQFGGCRSINRKMTDCVLAKDWSRLEGLVDQFMDQVNRLEKPADWRSGRGPFPTVAPDDEPSGA
jgi:hypothetical protein